jgi:hypothetical protein
MSQIAASMSDPTVQQMHQAIPPFFPHLWLSLQPPSVHPLHSDDACRGMTVCSYVSSNCFQSWVKYCHEKINIRFQFCPRLGLYLFVN